MSKVNYDKKRSEALKAIYVARVKAAQEAKKAEAAAAALETKAA